MLGWTGSGGLAVADKWLTFDCYGTVGDWNTCMGGALKAIAGLSWADAGRLLAACHQAELEGEAGPGWPPSREALTAGLGRSADRAQIPLSPGRAEGGGGGGGW